jgi:hypothetical protein
MERERRDLSAPIEVRDNSRTVAGYAAVFNSPTDIGGAFREQIAPGAFTKALTGDVRALFDHDTSMVLGRTKSGTLRLSEDSRGLAVEIDLPDTQLGRDLSASLARGDIDGMSFGFRVTDQEWDETGNTPLRTIRGVELFEVSVVTFPAYADTEVALRSLEQSRNSEGDRSGVERFLARSKMSVTLRKASRK